VNDFAHLRERGLTQENVFRGNLLRIRVDTVVLPNGEIAAREIVEHPGAAAVVPLTADNRVLLVRQYRYPIDAIMLELPCGKLDVGEDATECARRELQVETGCAAASLIYLGAMHSSPGCSNEVIHVYAAKEFTTGTPSGDADEFIEVETVPLDTAIAMIFRGEITDAKTIMGLLWVQQFGCTSKQTPPVRGTVSDNDAS
jgi:ADP-ribose pyrophosphatase